MNKILLGGLLIFMLGACERPEKVPPELPDASVFDIDMSVFDGCEEGGSRAKAAYDAVSPWMTIFDDSAVLCLNAFDFYPGTEPVYLSEQYWVWETQFLYRDSVYQAGLYGLEAADTSYWDHYVSFDTIENYHWAEGEVFFADDSALWTVYPHPQVVDGKKIDLVYKPNYVMIEKGDEYLMYKDSIFESFNQYWEIGLETGYLVCIFTNSENGKGKIQHEAFFGNDVWRCWDEGLQNSDCP